MPSYQDQEDADTSPPLMQRPKSPRKKLEESYNFQLLDMYASSFEMTYKAVNVKLSRYMHKGKYRIVLEIRARPHLAPLMAIDMNIAGSRKIYRGLKRLSRKRKYRRNDAKKEAA
jgi:hypothetical protein